MDQEYKNLQSTKPVKNDVQELDSTTEQENNNIKTNYFMCAIFSAEELCKSYSDKTGKFPITSSRGHKYIFVFYHYDANTINGIVIKIRNTTEICEAWQTAYYQLKARGEAPNIHILDKKISNDTKTIFKESQVEYQLVPPHIHRRNTTERAIHTFKNHLITGLYTCDPKVPSREWDRLLTQCNITINLLISARRNTSLSAYATLLGKFNFNATPMAPPSTRRVPSQDGLFALIIWYVEETLY